MTARTPTSSHPHPKGPMPGDLPREALIARMIRVDQAGEFGARRIYEGQIAILGNRPVAKTLRHMQEQEARHLETFERMMVERRVRPTLLSPLWRAAGFALGAGTALLGEKAAMACTVAIEETIDEHYRAQRAIIGDGDRELADAIDEFRAEELEHRDIGLEHGAHQTPGYTLLYAAISRGSKLAIWLSERI